MSGLNWKNTHFNLIVNKDYILYQKGSLKFQSEQFAQVNKNTKANLNTIEKEKTEISQTIEPSNDTTSNLYQIKCLDYECEAKLQKKNDKIKNI